MKQFFKKDSFQFGLAIGSVLPWAIFGILYGINSVIGKWHYNVPFIQVSTLMLISIIGNVLLMRYYLVKLKYEKSGKGVLIFTFCYIILFFFYDYVLK